MPNFVEYMGFSGSIPMVWSGFHEEIQHCNRETANVPSASIWIIPGTTSEELDRPNKE